jgi:hypothetical protein
MTYRVSWFRRSFIDPLGLNRVLSAARYTHPGRIQEFGMSLCQGTLANGYWNFRSEVMEAFTSDGATKGFARRVEVDDGGFIDVEYVVEFDSEDAAVAFKLKWM